MKIFLVSLLLSCAVGVAQADSPIRIENLRAAETPPGAVTGAIYLDIVNTGEADRLLGAEASEVTDHVELHATRLEGTMMQMIPLAALDVGRQATTSLKPGGTHLMLIGLKRPLQAGQHLPLTLRFERAGTLPLSAPIVKREALSGTSHDHSGHHRP